VSDVFEEVEEGLRQDKYTTFFKKYRNWLIAGVVVFLGSIGAFQAFQSWQSSQSVSYADRMNAAEKLLQARDFPGAQKAFTDIAAGAPAGYKTMALMQAAAARAAQADFKGALADYDKAAAGAPDATFRDVARMKAAYIASDLEDFKALEARLKPIVDGGGALAFQARELIGVQAYANGDTARAREEFNYLTVALDAPPSVRQRAQISLAALGPAPAAKETAEPASAPAAATGAKP
jgi:hypothetical protein